MTTAIKHSSVRGTRVLPCVSRDNRPLSLPFPQPRSCPTIGHDAGQNPNAPMQTASHSSLGKYVAELLPHGYLYFTSAWRNVKTQESTHPSSVIDPCAVRNRYPIRTPRSSEVAGAGSNPAALNLQSLMTIACRENAPHKKERHLCTRIKTLRPQVWPSISRQSGTTGRSASTTLARLAASIRQ